jgi:hypothetical protein
MADYAATIDEYLTISVHMLGGFEGLPLAIRDGGSDIDLSTAALFFEIPAVGFRRALTFDVSTPRKRFLPPITRAECATVPVGGADYVVWDEDAPDYRVDLFSGRFERYARGPGRSFVNAIGQTIIVNRALARPVIVHRTVLARAQEVVPPPAFIPALRFNDARNSMYL